MALAFVVVSLLLLLAVPPLLRARSAALSARVAAETTRADHHLSALQTVLALKVAATRGYLISGDTAFRTRYRVAAMVEERALRGLDAVAPRLGPDGPPAVAALRAAGARWSDAHRALMSGRESREAQAARLPQQQGRFEDVTRATRRLADVVRRAEGTLRARVDRAERTTGRVTTLLAALALASMLVVLRLGRRLDRALAGEVRERSRVEDALRESEERYRHLVELSPYAVLVHAEGGILYANPAAATLLGAASADALLGMPVLEFVHPRDREGARARVERLLTEGGVAEPAREKLVRLDGSGVVAEVAGAAVRFRDVDAVQIIVRDVSVQLAAEEALRRSERRFRSLLEHAHEPLVVLEGDGEVRFASPAAEQTLGIALDRIGPDQLADLLHPDDGEAAMAAFDRAIRSPATPQRLEFRIRHAGGEWRVLDAVGTSLLHDPDVGAVIINARDVTERRAAEAALSDSQLQLFQAQKMEAVGKLAGGIAHDFNNLLTAIKGNAQMLLLEIAAGDRLQEDVLEIDRAATRAAALTGQLLAFSRRQVLHPEVLDLNAVITSLHRMLRRMLGSDVEIATVLGPDVARIRADPVQFEQVLVNLAVNARDAMPGGGRLLVETRDVQLAAHEVLHPSMPPGRYALLRVGDTGTGIAPEHMERIWEPFFTTKPVGQGTGLGLSTVYGIVKQSGGWIWADSEVGRGTVFHIYLPAVDSEPTPVRVEAAAPSAAHGRETVLMAEDHDAVRRLARRTLEAKGYRVLEAANGDEALHLFEQEGAGVDLLLTDLVMPLVGGRELAARIKAQRPEMPVIFISGYTDEAVLRSEVFEPGTEFLQKPFEPEALARKVRAVLDAAAGGPHRAG